MQSILLVEDDLEISRLIVLHAHAVPYVVICCSDVKSAMDSSQNGKFDLIILDISLPDGNGLDFCRQLRLKDLTTPVLMLTCHGDESDKVLALEIGADDYVTKPFGVLELMARIKAMMRRSKIRSEDAIDEKEVHYKGLVVNHSKRKAALNDNRLDLTVKEFDLLWLLANHPGKTFTRRELLEEVWGIAFAGYEHTVTSHINRLRIKLEQDLSHPVYILTAWGSGYRFAE